MDKEYRKKLEALEKKLGFKFHRRDLLVKALTHESFLADYNYERMEFLGDALLFESVTLFLYSNHKHATPGEMSKIRGNICRNDVLSLCGLELGLQDLIRMSESSKLFYNDHPDKHLKVVADCIEAIFTAVYKDADAGLFRKFANNIVVELNRIQKNHDFSDWKDKLKNVALVTPVYRALIHKKGEPWEVQVAVSGFGVMRGKGLTKAMAEQAAAKSMFRRIKSTNIVLGK